MRVDFLPVILTHRTVRSESNSVCTSAGWHSTMLAIFLYARFSSTNGSAGATRCRNGWHGLDMPTETVRGFCGLAPAPRAHCSLELRSLVPAWSSFAWRIRANSERVPPVSADCKFAWLPFVSRKEWPRQRRTTCANGCRRGAAGAERMSWKSDSVEGTSMEYAVVAFTEEEIKG